jgi:hypothetical protein
MKTTILAGVVVALCASFAVLSYAAPEAQVAAKDEDPADASSKAEEQALAATEAWLKLVDNGHYAESWDAAAEYLKNAVSKDAFVKALDGARKPLGAMISRKVKAKEYRTSLPGAPDGKYVIIQHETSFANKKSAIETVTPMLDKDDTWRVSGYYIK